jgi:hypothetical protein
MFIVSTCMRYVFASYEHIPYTCTLIQLINVLIIIDYYIFNGMFFIM